MKNKAIGVFDSGLGGLTAVKEIMKIMPDENIVYFGDTGRVPYGSRSKDTIVKYTKQDIAFLKEHNIKALVVACGTASSVALPEIKDIGIKTFGVVEPAVDKAISLTKNGKIGIIGTVGTIKSKSYENLILSKGDYSVTAVACPLFVPLVENGYINGEATKIIAKEYLEDILSNGCDTLILGCTHYPLLKDIINEVTENKIELIDVGKTVAKQVKEHLEKADILNVAGGTCSYYVSDSVSNFQEMAEMFLDKKIETITQVDIDKIKVDEDGK